MSDSIVIITPHRPRRHRRSMSHDKSLNRSVLFSCPRWWPAKRGWYLRRPSLPLVVDRDSNPTRSPELPLRAAAIISNSSSLAPPASDANRGQEICAFTMFLSGLPLRDWRWLKQSDGWEKSISSILVSLERWTMRNHKIFRVWRVIRGEEQLHRMVWLSCYEKSSSSCIDGGAGRVCWYNMIDDVVRSGLGLFWFFLLLILHHLGSDYVTGE